MATPLGNRFEQLPTPAEEPIAGSTTDQPGAPAPEGVQQQPAPAKRPSAFGNDGDDMSDYDPATEDAGDAGDTAGEDKSAAPGP